LVILLRRYLENEPTEVMSRRFAVVLVVACAVLIPREASAQSFDPRLSFRLGLINEIGAPGGEYHNVFYPEVEVENRLFTFGDAGISLSGSAFLGFWSDEFSLKGDDCSRRCSSYRSIAVGTRVRAVLLKPVLPFGAFGSLYVGLSYRAFSREYTLSRTSLQINEQLKYAAAETGVSLEVPFFKASRLIVQLQGHLLLPEPDRPLGDLLKPTLGVSVPL
jgi:hypothetical protein